MATTIEQAAINALVAYLQPQLTDVKVTPWWVDPDVTLPPLAVSVIKVGARRQIDTVGRDAMPLDSRELTPASEVRKDYLWHVGQFEQRVQIDLWARNQAPLEDLTERVWRALHAGLEATLGSTDFYGRAPMRDGLLLRLDPNDGHEGFADLTMDDGQESEATADRVQRGEWRTMLLGQFTVSLNYWAPTYRQAQITMRHKISTAALGSGTSQDTTVEAEG